MCGCNAHSIAVKSRGLCLPLLLLAAAAQFGIFGTLLGAFVIIFLADGLVIIGVSFYWQTVFTGAVIVLAVLLNSIQYRGKRRAG